MRFTDALLNPNGRLSRGGFWMGSLTLAAMTALAVYSLQSLSRALAPQMSTYGPALVDEGMRPILIGLILAIPVAWMSFCLLVKRWHDRGRSGWWVIVGLVPVIGNLWALVECALLPGGVSGNKYGPAPLKGRPISHWDGDEIPEDMA
jgi:uncharacterized membrane protein YhaH (DUF805 family)